MAITAADIKLLESERMSDTTDGGGRKTSRVIPDGVAGNIFPKVSRVDSVYGRVNLRKVYGAVLTGDVSTYAGSHAVITDPPDNSKIHTTLFSTASEFDARTNARDRIEAYLNKGSMWPGYLLENHIAGQKSIQLFQRDGVSPPSVGHTLCLVFNEGLAGQVEQYVRVTRSTVETRTFTALAGSGWVDFQATVVTCDLTESLRYDFPGSPPDRGYAPQTGKTKVRDTLVADAAAYYGIAALGLPATQGSKSLKVGSIYTQLVPSSQSETSLTDIRPSAEFSLTLATAPREVVVGGSSLSQRIKISQENRGYNYITILKPLPAPGSVYITYRALGRNYKITDDGNGNLVGLGTGTINYGTGSLSVTLQAPPDDRSSLIIYWGPNVSYTNRTTGSNFRAPEYTITLGHRGVDKGSFSITWLSGNVLKTAAGTNNGTLTGDASGEINYIAGLVFIRPAAMPDAGTEFSIDYTWSSLVEEIKTGLSPDVTGTIAIVLNDEPIPGTVEVQWLTNRIGSVTAGVTLSASTTAKASEGGIKRIGSYANFETIYSNFVLPDAADEDTSTAAWVTTGIVEKVGYQIPRNTRFTASASGAASHAMSTQQTSKNEVTVHNAVTDDGLGALFGTFGFVSYATKTLTVKVIQNYEETTYNSNSEHAGSWEAANDSPGWTANYPAITNSGGGAQSQTGGEHSSVTKQEVLGTAGVLVRYKTGLLTPTAVTETFTPDEVVIDLCPHTKDIIVPGSVQFTWMGKTYVDFEGAIYRDRTAINPGIDSGAIDYMAGVAYMSDYVVAGPATSLSINSLWTMKPQPRTSQISFGVTASPVKPTGLVFSCLDVNGAQLIGTANLDGEISGTHIRGVIDYESGTVDILFGDYLVDVTLTADDKAEWWYNAADIRTDGKIWRPWPVLPSTLRYNAVTYAYLPLNAATIGIDPVRLPADGKVPIFRPAVVVVVHNTQSTALINPVVAGASYSVGRANLSECWLVDQNGIKLGAGQYSVNMNTGAVTIAADFAAGTLVQPLNAKHRVEDMGLLTDVQITGHLTLSEPLSRDYGSDSYVSSALLFGDMNARVTDVYDELAFASWSATTYTGANAQYNNIDYPIEVLNNGAVTESWRINFTSSSAYQVIGENMGVILTGTTGADCAPTSLLTGLPFFVLRSAGWGSGWAAGNQLRFKTISAAAPIWIARTILPGATLEGDFFALQMRGDVDA